MPQAMANGLCLEYETFGDPEHPAILLIMGLGGQLILWPDRFCERLAEAGYFVVRFDNRDVGLSSKLDTLGKPRLLYAGLAYRLGLPNKAAYSLDDMAADAIGLLDTLKIRRAHIVGASMGGMIAQIIGARYPLRIRSLVLMMTTSGNPRMPGPALNIGLRLVRRPDGKGERQHIEHHVRTWQMIGSPAYRLSPEEMRAHFRRSFQRSYHPHGVARQAAAIFASGSRVPLIRRISAPALIIHGRDDRLVPVAAAYELLRLIAGAKLEVIAGMGHDLPQPLLARIADSILLHLDGAGTDAGLTSALAPQSRTSPPPLRGREPSGAPMRTMF